MIDLEPKGLDQIPTKKTEIPTELQPVKEVAQPSVKLNAKDLFNILKGFGRSKALELIGAEPTQSSTISIIILIIVIIITVVSIL